MHLEQYFNGNAARPMTRPIEAWHTMLLGIGILDEVDLETSCMSRMREPQRYQGSRSGFDHIGAAIVASSSEDFQHTRVIP